MPRIGRRTALLAATFVAIGVGMVPATLAGESPLVGPEAAQLAAEA